MLQSSPLSRDLEGGQLSPQQSELIRAAAAGMPRDAKIIAATDAHEPGGKLADSIREAVALTGRDDLVFVLHQPEGFKDWNDQLRKRPKSHHNSSSPESSVT
jgi:DNA primase